MTEEQTDKMLGGFIATHRNYAGLSIWQAARRSGINSYRWRCLEKGSVLIGARKRELQEISRVLELDRVDLERRACGLQ